MICYKKQKNTRLGCYCTRFIRRWYRADYALVWLRFDLLQARLFSSFVEWYFVIYKIL